MKPQMFVGSSAEAIRIAQSIQNNLFHIVDSTIWSQGVFGIGGTALDSLLKQAKKADFATFVLSPDDLTTMRKKDVKVARDNVVLELGLFAGVLGAERVFFVTPQDSDIHMPSDLLGITPATYKEGSHSGNMDACLGVASNLIGAAVSRLINAGPGFTNLNGNWRGVWYSSRPTYPDQNEFFTDLIHIGDSIRSVFESNGETYSVEGNIHRGNLVTGTWGSPEAGATYFGPFQLVISPDGKTMKGRWMGFTRANGVDSNLFEWERVEKSPK